MSHDGVKGWVFKLVCPGNTMSVSHKRLLLLKNATVNRNLGFDDVCRYKNVVVAYNNEFPVFEVSQVTGEMVKFQVRNYLHEGSIAREWEIQATFFATNNINPKWINANFNWGILNDTTGQWSGAVGLIQRDEADYAIFGFGPTYDRSKVAAFSPVMHYSPLHWLTRRPQELSPIWNLVGLFTKGSKSQISNHIISNLIEVLPYKYAFKGHACHIVCVAVRVILLGYQISNEKQRF